MKKDFDKDLKDQLTNTTKALRFRNKKLSNEQINKIFEELNARPEIFTLELKNCELEDQQAEKFFNLAQLLELDLTGNNLTNKVAEFCSKNESLNSLNLSANEKINNGFFANFNNKSIQTLFLGRTEVCRLDGLQDNKSLINLHLNHTNLKGSTFKEFKDHPTLQFLNLCSAEVKESSIKQLIQLERSILNYIEVSGVAFNEETKMQLNKFVQKNLKSYFSSLCQSLVSLHLEPVAPLIGEYLLNSETVGPKKLTKLSKTYFQGLISKPKEPDSSNQTSSERRLSFN